MTIEIPEWRKAWKVDDPEWVKQRKKQWREISKSKVFNCPGWGFSKKEITQIKNYFMTGSAFLIEPDPSEWPSLRCYHPNNNPLPVSCDLFFRCWLHPEYDLDFWKSLLIDRQDIEISNSRHFLRERFKYVYPSKGTLFTGSDRELYYFFGPTRCRREDFSDITDKLYNDKAESCLFAFHKMISEYLLEDNPDSIVNEVFPEWSDAVVPAFSSFDDFNFELQIEKLSKDFENAKKIIDGDGDFSEGQLSFVKRFVETFKQMKLPKKMNSIKVMLEEF